MIGLVLALMSKNADIRPKKAFLGRAVMGIILSNVAIGLTMFFFYSLISFYDALNDPVMGPQINELINRLTDQPADAAGRARRLRLPVPRSVRAFSRFSQMQAAGQCPALPACNS